MKIRSGFTLIELMIVIVVLAIILTLAVPSFRSVIQNNRATTIANELVGALQTARSEALKLRENVTVCRSAGGTVCENGTDWSVGWIVCSGACGADDLIRVWEAVPGDGSVTAGNVAGIAFQPTGMVAAGDSFQVVVPGCTGNHRYTTAVAVSGQVTQTRSACP